MIILDDYLRNYPCVLTDNFELDEEFEKLAVIRGKVKLNNYTGYSQATHFYTAYSSPSAHTSLFTQKFNFGSNLEPFVRLNIGVVDTQGLTSFTIKNNNQMLTVAGNYTNNDTLSIINDPASVEINNQSAPFTGQIPNWTTGVNLTEISYTSNTTTTIDTNTGENPPKTDYYWVQAGYRTVGYDTANRAFRIGQSFVLSSTRDVESLEFWIGRSRSYSTNVISMRVSIYSDTLGVPGTETQLIVNNFIVNNGVGVVNTPTKVFLPVNFSLSGGTHWLVIQNMLDNGYSNYFDVVSNKTDTYTSGQLKILVDNVWRSPTGHSSETTSRPPFDIQLIIKLKQGTQSQYSWDLQAKKRYV